MGTQASIILTSSSDAEPAYVALAHQAGHAPLTGLANQRRFLSELSLALRHSFGVAPGHPRLSFGINLLSIQFRSGSLVDDICSALARNVLPPELLEIIKRTILKQDAMLKLPQQLREDSGGVVFDDFGTGYASLSMLKRYPITRLKVDRSFVRNLCDSVQDASIIRAVVHMAKAFGLEVIAEGVETEEQMRRLLANGCDELHGFMFGRPMPAGEFYALIECAGEKRVAARG